MPKHVTPVKDSFVFPTAWSAAIIGLSDEDAGRLLKAVYAYNYEGQIREQFLTDNLYHIFMFMKPFFDGEMVSASNVGGED